MLPHGPPWTPAPVPPQVGYDPVFGARPVKRALQRELQTLLAKALLRGEFEEEDTIVVEAATEAEAAEGAKAKLVTGSYASGLVLRKGPKIALPGGKPPAAAAAAAEGGAESGAESGAEGAETQQGALATEGSAAGGVVSEPSSRGPKEVDQGGYEQDGEDEDM